MKKILIIEDNVKLKEQIAYTLIKEGYEVYNADNGFQGIQKFNEILPDLVLCDIAMPGMDGYEVLKSIRSVEDQLLCPFIFITALSERNNFRTGMELGANDYLVKPFTVEELLNALKAQLNKSNSIIRHFKLQIEAIEFDLQKQLFEAKEEYDKQKLALENLTMKNEQTLAQLKEKQAELMQEALRSIETNSKLQDMARELSAELLKPAIDDEHKQILIQLRNKIRKKSVLLNNWTIFQLKFNQIFPNFNSILVLKYPQLTQQERVIISAFYTNLNAHQLSIILNIKASSVRKYKYRIKLKLGLDKDDDLNQFVHQLYQNSNDS